ncbi:3-oxoacyl-ACP synthase III family protein [Candidatus Contendibacter odensensis]|uniref:3-oxoacyl-(Acyl-carrier-protein) synthase III n=1 Tax=Candidatus Contendobacter odensis Run_B_J11 TaxID=1400861 RepID=A0A7U7GDW5_9GAMM|nr:ketoacyl-ACP synthase III [Candidatus Contendobacter odensis]CDH46019.1 3-oxoacyl-(acyl-carrier-protein) synthase III [Candidatus Contendobacter odensis Run_B_J11]
MRHAQIISTGGYVPERVMTNADFDQLLGEPVGDWLVENVGIRERHFMAEEQVTSDLAVAAGRIALERAGLEPNDLDRIIVATDTPDYLSPATAAVVQAKLGARRAGVFDLNSACAGWVTALDVAAKTIIIEREERFMLVIGAYGMSRFLDWNDKKTVTLFADGAGAVIVGAGSQPGWLATVTAAAGEYHDALGIYSGGTYRPATAANLTQYGPPQVQFVRKFPATFNTEQWPPLIERLLAKASAATGVRLQPDDVNHYYFTQVNLRVIEATMAAIGQPLSKTHWIMDKWGYTGSACIPMALDDALAQGKGPQPGSLALFCASGGGIALAASLWRWR